MGIKPSTNRDQSMNKSGSSSFTSSASSTVESSLDIQIKDLETFTLVWLDSDIDQEDLNGRLRKILREQFTSLLTFNDFKSCEEWFKNQSSYEKILLIVSGEFGKRITLNIHQLPSIVYIYIYCWQPERYLEWTSNYPKVRAVYSQSQILIEKISKDQIYWENIEDSKGIQIFQNRPSSLIINVEMISFICSKLILQILLTPSYFSLSASSSELINLLRQLSSNNKEDLDLIKQFEFTYNQENSIEWLTKTTPFARLINKVLREENLSMLFYLRFFLIDILNQLKPNQLSSAHVYRKQIMPLAILEKLRNNGKNFLMFRQFLYTSTKAPELSSVDTNETQFETVLMEINAENRHGSTPFAKLDKTMMIDDDQNDSTIVFMCGSIFQINSLRKNVDSTYTLKLSLVENNQFPFLMAKQDELRKINDLMIISQLLDQSNQSDKINIFCQQLLKQFPSDHSIISQINEKLNINTKIAEGIESSLRQQCIRSHLVSLTNSTFILIDILERLTPLASAMLNTLQSSNNNSIITCLNLEEIDLHLMKNKTIFIFITSDLFSSIRKQISQTAVFFILEDNHYQNNQIGHFNNSEDLIFQLADQLYQSYIQEAKDHFKSGNIYLATEKQQLAKQIDIQLKEVHRVFSEKQNKSEIQISPITTLIWLTFNHKNYDNIIQHTKKIFEKVVSSILIFDDVNDCFSHVCTTEYSNSVFIIIDNDYKDISILTLQQLNNVKQIYRYIQTSTIEDNRDNLRSRLIHHLISHYNHLSNQYKERNDSNNVQEIFSKMIDLCKLL